MTLKEQLRLATQHLDPQALEVWIAKHLHGYGRRAGSLALGITEEQFRHRLHRADSTMKRILNEERRDAA
jgi:DNA-directed RNA polymerase specialized sigma24 family protein